MPVEIIIGLSVIAVIVIVLMRSLRQKNPSDGNRVGDVPDESSPVRKIVPDEPSFSVPQPLPDRHRAAGISPEEFGDTFFSGMLSEEEALAEFEKLKGKTVTWSGIVRNGFQYNSDLNFGAKPGLRLMIDVSEVPDEYGMPQSVSAIASFPPEYAERPGDLRGRQIRFKGTFLKIEPRTRNVYLTDAE